MNTSEGGGCDLEYNIIVAISGLCVPFMTVEENTQQWKSLQLILPNIADLRC